MINISINNSPIYPVDGGQFELHEANPMLTEAGTYSYDIDVDLSAKENQQVYAHLDRFNSDNVFNQRQAIIDDDGRIICMGSESLLELNGQKLKIQIVSGNSDLNLLSNNTKILDLDLGSVTTPTPEDALKTLEDYFPKSNGVYCPIMTKFKDLPRPETTTFANFIYQNTHDSIHYVENTTFIFQPYLIFLLEKILQTLGWSIAYNILREDESACRMIVVHGYKTQKLNEMLPNWEVSEFLSQIEKFFNVVILCNVAEKTVSIYRVADFYNKVADTVIISDDQILSGDLVASRKFNLTETFSTNYSNVKYNFPSVWKYQYANLSDDVRKIVKVLEFDSFADFDTKEYKSDDYFNKPYIFRDKSTSTDFVLVNYRRTSTAVYHFEPVDIFASIKSDDNSDEISLKICPAEVLAVDLHPDIDGPKLMGAAIPFARNQEILEQDSSSDDGLNQWIQNGAPEKYDSSKNNIYVSYYMGLINVLHGESSDPDLENLYNSVMYPQCVTYPYIMQFYSISGTPGDIFSWRKILKRTDFAHFNFNLKYLSSALYANNTPIDNSTEYEINFSFNVRPDVRSKFIISNRLYFCKEIIYYFEQGKISPYAKGIFFPAK